MYAPLTPQKSQIVNVANKKRNREKPTAVFHSGEFVNNGNGKNNMSSVTSSVTSKTLSKTSPNSSSYLTLSSPSTPLTPLTEINWNWSSKPMVNIHRIMEQASTVTLWSLSIKLPLREIQTLFEKSEVKKGSLFIEGTKDSNPIKPASRIFSSGTFTCASCCHYANVERGNEIIQILRRNGYVFESEFKGDCASTYNGSFFTKGIKAEKKKRKTTTTTGNKLRLDILFKIIKSKTKLDNVNYNSELQNCLTIVLPTNIEIPWSTEGHYKFSDTFNARVKTFMHIRHLKNKAQSKQSQSKLPYTMDAMKCLFKWIAYTEQLHQKEQGDPEKQGSLRIFSTGKICALGVKNCELVQDVVENIDRLIKKYNTDIIH